MTTNETPSQVVIRKSIPQEKFIPLIVSYNNLSRPAKLYDNKTIEEGITEILKTYDLLKDQKASNYGLKLKNKNNLNTQYINENNRYELLALNDECKFHDVILCFNLHIEAKNLIEKLFNLKSNQNDVCLSLLNELQLNIENDKNFAFEIYANKGKSLLIDNILKWQESNDVKQWKILYSLYKTLNILIEQCNISWDSSDIDVNIIKVICDILNNSHKQQNIKRVTTPQLNPAQQHQQQQNIEFENEMDKLILLFLKILNSIMINSEQMRQFSIRNLKFNEIIFLLSRKCVLIKEVLVQLINNSFNKGDYDLKSRLCDIMCQISVKKLLSNLCMSLKNEHDLFKNLAILQKNTLNIKCLKLVEEYNNTDKVKEILEIIVDNSFKSNALVQQDEKYNYKRLGFLNQTNPLKHFEEEKDASNYLALEFMRFFSDTYKPQFQAMINDEKTIKSPDYAFPFAKASIALVKLIYNLLKIDVTLVEENDEQLKQFQLVFVLLYQTIDGLYEFFSNCLILFYKLWSDMKAQHLDFDRALLVFKDSLYKILNDLNNQNKSDFYYKKIEQFYFDMRALNYDKMKIPILAEKLNKAPFHQLKSILTNEVMSMIRPKRLSVLCKGDVFYTKVLPRERDKKGKSKQFLWKLSSDLSQFSYCDNETADMDLTRCDGLQIDYIQEIKKEEARKDKYPYSNIQLVCLSNDKANSETYVLGHDNDDIIDLWYECLNMLVDPKKTSNVACFVECLFDTQLLDIHKLGLNYVPNEIPPVPELPPDFDYDTVFTN